MTPAAVAQDWIAHAPLEELVTSREFFGLTTASPVQRAVCRIIDGAPLGELVDDPSVRELVGTDPRELASASPSEVSWIGPIRSAKSFIAAACCVRWSQRCDVAMLKGGEVPRIPVISLDKSKAKAVLDHVQGGVRQSPVLRLIRVRETSEGLVLRHPTGRHVEVRVVAGKRAGSAVVAFWLGGVVFDEFPRMHGADDAVVNWEETRNSALGRVLPGGQIVNIGSPWAPFGPAYEQFSEHYGKPSPRFVVLWSDGPRTNPVWWTPERVAESAATNPNHRTDVETKFATPEEALFPVEQIERACRAGVLPPKPRADYAAAMDPATRGNGWTLVLATREGRRIRVVLAEERVGTRDVPLHSGETLAEFAALLEPYGVDLVETDQYYVDALKEIALAPTYVGRDGIQRTKRSLRLIEHRRTEQQKTEASLTLRTRLGEGDVEIVPAMKSDLMRVRKKVTQAGVSIVLPHTSDGRHCDFYPPLLIVCTRYLADVAPPPADEAKAEMDRMRKAVERRWIRREDDE